MKDTRDHRKILENTMGHIPTTLAFLIDWGWLRIGPYIHINMVPALLHIGSLRLTWYGLAYVLGITMGLWFIRGYTARMGSSQDLVYRVVCWCVIGGVVGGRLRKRPIERSLLI